MRLVAAAAALEALTGLVLAISPSFVAWLLFGARLDAPGEAVGRVAGFALLSLALACWPANVTTTTAASTRGLFLYNVLAAIFFLYLGLSHALVGVILWPAVAVHGILSVLLARLLAVKTP
ncbi:MAG TPA: hypothetical protein VIW73_09200 [Candidatus Cybelea sp.]